MPQTEMIEEEKEAKYYGTEETIYLRIMARQYFKRLIPTRNLISIYEIFTNTHHDIKDSIANERLSLAF